jgi:tetratricopeptide (TPR) repeat protein
MRCLLGLWLLAFAPLAHSQTCDKCHAGIISRHSRIIQPAGKQGEYTLGGRRIRQNLTTMPDGRIVIGPQAWDVAGKKWIPASEVENPEESGEVWNKDCYGCHVTGEKKNFDLEHNRYHTTWQSLGANCQRCHGDSADHKKLLNPAKLDAARSTMLCAQCHSFRDIYADGFPAGANYYDYFQPVMEYRLPPSEDPAYWPDGRPRWFNNEAAALWQSQCFLKGGVSCTTCHSNTHKPEAKLTSSVCSGCHKAIAADVPAHTHHASKSAGSSCLECHMPAVTVGLRARMRDHSMSIPTPEIAAPNACNLCHKDMDAARQMTAWWGDRSRQKPIRRAAAFTGAKKADRAAVPALLQIVADLSEAPWIRANAAGYLGGFPDDPAAYDAVRRAFGDPDPLVRATAAAAIRPRAAQREALAPELVALLKDPILTVRMNAGIALVAMGVKPFPGEDGARFERAKELYRARAELNSDDAGQQLAAGRFFFLAGDMEESAAAFRAAMKLDPATPAQYLLARALYGKADYAGALQVLKTIPRSDAQYAPAEQLAAEIEAKDPVHAGGADPQQQFLQAQVLVKGQYYGAALQALDQALRAEPSAEWATEARIYRAICLEKLSRAPEAEAAMQALGDNPDIDLQLAYVELLLDTGRADAALPRIDKVIAADPKTPMAHFWRAKVLLELHRPADAAAAAEESIRLQAELPEAHNLLIRIYQMQGRTKEAAQQAQWLRDYQRRVVLH